MPPIKKKEGIIAVLDIGKWASNEIVVDGLSFLEISKKCIERIILRKIFSTPNDEIALVLVGSDNSNNNRNLSNISEGFQMMEASFEMVKIVQSLKGSDVDKYDWIDGIVVAMDILLSQSEVKDFTTWKIVTFVTLDQEVRTGTLDSISMALKDNEIQLTAIGADLFPANHPPLEDIDEVSILGDINEKSGRERGEAVLKYIILKCDGITCDLTEALSQLKTYSYRETKPLPWNATLDIGRRIKIPVAVVRKLSGDYKPARMKRVAFENPEKVFETGSSEQMILMDRETSYMKPDSKIVDRCDRIKGYLFGSSVVPLNEYDADEIKYKTGEKCLSLLGFARRNDVKRHLFMGDGGYYVLPQKKFPQHRQTLSAFIHALAEQRKVGIATRVYRKGSKPNIVALFPIIDDEIGERLFLVQLPFSENVCDFVFPHAIEEKDPPTDEELAVVDKLMDTLDLSDDESCGTELFVEGTENPNKVHLFNCIAHRALYPDKPLPSVSEEVKEILASPFETKAEYKSILEVVKQKFGLVETKKVSKRKAKLQKPEEKSEAQPGPANPYPAVTKEDFLLSVDFTHKLKRMQNPTLLAGGLIKPHEDFVTLIDLGENFENVCDQMQKAILKLVLNSFADQSFGKALRCVSTMRSYCVVRNPLVYNNWLPGFKTSLDDRNRMAFWDLVVKDNLGLISSEESPFSSLSPDEARKLFQSNEAAPKEDEEEIDVVNLFDEGF